MFSDSNFWNGMQTYLKVLLHVKSGSNISKPICPFFNRSHHHQNAIKLLQSLASSRRKQLPVSPSITPLPSSTYYVVPNISRRDRTLNWETACYWIRRTYSTTILWSGIVKLWLKLGPFLFFNVETFRWHC